ncbi:CBS domain-containing protein [Verrucosispora sioxanthis]|uniref:CBS domain-containing protein n=1 Tax=Verrucosispora sioxanthis TaxID=2499994 RepID=A0A6M1L426_9ACTN|nr:CBS domain-containing protein [Verrucosispora sioxanthis]NEE63780.1 CBS domain-containing protein [Verrucosispora sioxanthis]NGM12890.1 CBS domain-containing protein [Verrucosispora sioxanthis]
MTTRASKRKSQWTVGDVMTGDVVSVRPDTSYREVVDTLMGRGVSAAPVVDPDGRVLGVVSEADLLHKIEAAGDERHRRIIGVRRVAAKAQATVAADLMTVPAVVVEPTASVAAAARRMEAARVKRMPVVDADRRLVGIVSRRDLLRIHTRPDEEVSADVVDIVLRGLWIAPDTVTVGVADGVVTLSGTVESRSLAGMVADHTARLAGVVEVVDELDWERDDSELIESRGYAFGSAERLMRPSRD